MGHDTDSGIDAGAGEVMLAGGEDSSGLIAESLEADGHRCDRAAGFGAARRRVLECRYDVIVLDLDALAGHAFEIVQLAARLSPATVCVIRSRSATVATVLAAMRAGIGDFLVGSLPVPQLRLRIRAAVRRARDARQRIERMARLTSICRSLVARRGDESANVEELAALMGDDEDSSIASDSGERAGPEANANPEIESLTGTAPEIGSDSEDFAEIASQQLDPERLITAAIEHLVGTLGPVNIAVYFGSGSCRFGLAAYARADLPRALLDKELAQWSVELCQQSAAFGRVQQVPQASSLLSPAATSDPRVVEELSRRVGVIVPCKKDGLCDALFVILPGAGSQLRDSQLIALSSLADTFAMQLVRIQKVHSRHLPSWPTEID